MPRPRSDLSEIRPPISWMLLRTTSMPTPRPEMSEIVSAVEKPGTKMRLLISSSVSVASGPTSPCSRAFLSTRSELMPAPSSRISMTIRPPRCSAREMDRALLVLAGGESVRRRLDAVVDRVADDVGQRIAEPLDDRAVDLGRLAGHLEPDLLAGLGRQLAHQPRHALEHRADRLRAHRHHAVLQLARVVDDLVEDLRQPAADRFRKVVHDLPEHRLGDHQFADHVDDAVDLFELDPGGGGGGLGRAASARPPPLSRGSRLRVGCARIARARCRGAGLRRRRRRERQLALRRRDELRASGSCRHLPVIASRPCRRMPASDPLR